MSGEARRIRELGAQENEADLLAAVGQFGMASRLMRWVNEQRAEIVGMSPRACPNLLRQQCEERLAHHEKDKSDG